MEAAKTKTPQGAERVDRRAAARCAADLLEHGVVRFGSHEAAECMWLEWSDVMPAGAEVDGSRLRMTGGSGE